MVVVSNAKRGYNREDFLASEENRSWENGGGKGMGNFEETCETPSVSWKFVSIVELSRDVFSTFCESRKNDRFMHRVPRFVERAPMHHDSLDSVFLLGEKNAYDPGVPGFASWMTDENSTRSWTWNRNRVEDGTSNGESRENHVSWSRGRDRRFREGRRRRGQTRKIYTPIQGCPEVQSGAWGCSYFGELSALIVYPSTNWLQVHAWCGYACGTLRYIRNEGNEYAIRRSGGEGGASSCAVWECPREMILNWPPSFVRVRALFSVNPRVAQ